MKKTKKVIQKAKPKAKPKAKKSPKRDKKQKTNKKIKTAEDIIKENETLGDKLLKELEV